MAILLYYLSDLNKESLYRDTGAAWILAQHGEIPPNAIPAGHEADGRALYIIRFITKGGQLTPGKLTANTREAHVSHGGKEVSSDAYQVLTHPHPQELKWVPTSGNNVPTGALQAGGDDRDPLFIGRAPFQGGICCGKFEPSHNCVYLPWGGHEHRVTDHFEVLCVTRICE